MKIDLRAVLAGIVAAALVFAAPAYSTFPGQNGKLAFSDFSGIWTIEPDGTGLTQLTTASGIDAGPAWSPDGSRIAFNSDRDGNFEIYVMNADGTNPRRLTTDPATDAGPAWSPDGSRIAFVSHRDGRAELYVMQADGTGQTRVTDTSDYESQPAWSSDGTRIALVSSAPCSFFPRTTCQAIYTVAPDGSGRTRMVLGTEPNWSPDGREIWGSVYSYAKLCDEFPSLIFSLDVATGVVTDYVKDCEFGEVGVFSPAVSPDNTQVAFATLFELQVMDRAGIFRTLPASGLDVDWQPIVGPRRPDYKNASKFCKAEREFLGEARFSEKYGGGANAHGRCVSAS